MDPGQSGWGDAKGESVGRGSWNWRALTGWCGNLVQWKLLGMYESDPNKVSLSSSRIQNLSCPSFVTRRVIQWQDWVACN